jgi:hypothetical protein
MKRLRYLGDKDYTLKYDSHGNPTTVVLKKNQWYHLPEENGEVKHLVRMKALTDKPTPGSIAQAPAPAAENTGKPDATDEVTNRVTTGQEGGE